MSIKRWGSQRGMLGKRKVIELLKFNDLHTLFVEHTGLEPVTSTLPVSHVEHTGLEPVTSTLPVSHSSQMS